MNHSRYEFADHGDHQPDAFDRDLDAALATYASVNPRTGLEGRIMAEIAAERKHSGVGFPWRWAAVAFVALSVMLAITIHLKSSKPGQHEIAGHMTQRPGALQLSSPSVHVSRVGTANSAHSKPHRQTVARLPKLEQFPSPQPLSEQEKVLADYVARFREEAVLIARINTEELMHERVQMNEDTERLQIPPN